MPELITETWLKEVGFIKHVFGGEPYKHWLLWLGFEDEIGIEVAFGANSSIGNKTPWWFCWARTGGAHTFDKFVHLRHVRTKYEVILIVEAISGRRWNPSSHRNGAVRGIRW
jgi:hypothetical protein